jgi:hypothetical protein
VADDKPGKVIRVDPITWSFLKERKGRRETISALVRRLIGLPSKKGIVDTTAKFALPSELFDSIEEARGAAIMKAVRAKKKPEEPVVVRTVG